MIQYDITFDSSKHLANVTLTVNKAKADNLLLRLPNWTPGSYLIRDYARHIVQISAKDKDSGQALAIRKCDNNSFECESAKNVEISYQVYGYDPSVRGCFIDEERIFINGAALFLEAVGIESPITVNLTPFDHQKDLKVATQLACDPSQKWTWGNYSAGDYQRLWDCPITIGHFKQMTFQVDNVEHTIVITGNVMGDCDKLKKDVQLICQAQAKVFQDSLPFDSYLFMLHLVEEGYGGLEHMDSSALLASSGCMPVNDHDCSKSYQLLLGLFSHEYFHVWNVKRIKPKEFLPFDLNTPNHTTLLWVFEGFTSYFDDLGLARSGTISEADYFQLLANALTRVIRTPGRFKQCLAHSSFDAWTKFYKPNENSPNQEVSYYTQGSIVACLLDMQIRLKSNHQKSLNDVMQILWQDFGKVERGLTADQIQEILVAHGIEQNFIEEAIYQTGELPIDKIFEQFGLKLIYQPRVQEELLYPEANAPMAEQGAFGWHVTQEADKLKVNYVFDGGAAIKAGIFAKDEIIALNETKVSKLNYANLTKYMNVNDSIKVTYFRDNQLKTATIKLQEPPMDIANIERHPHNSSEKNQWIDQWLGKKHEL